MKSDLLENNSQKSFFMAAVILFVVGIFLHNPFGGYDIPLVEYSPAPCSDSERAEYKKQLEFMKENGMRLTEDPTKEAAYIEQSLRECVSSPSGDHVPLAQWRSVSPIVWWFGSVQNIIAYSVAVVVVGFLGVFIFRVRKDV